ncbi:hypothetical protein TIFTF001_020649 [Ficus carica]|uniref:Bifunctional inhibitor/plant lipid transfer protein/seed storage helical domain-containing protein n=1 Tax=Ficus carica TaxID=3494 RepID=A0AA88ARU4_FICCA|nr:hypothetical protein TIFTF001_020649 [Ficus carica]
MAKLAALLAALILVANAAAALRTTTEDCSRQIQWRDLSDCMRYLREQLLNEEAYNKLDNRPEDYLDQCCGQLRMMSEWCRCDGLKSEINRQRQQGQLWGQDVSRIMQAADSLPGMCRNTEGPSRCDFGSSWF